MKNPPLIEKRGPRLSHVKIADNKIDDLFFAELAGIDAQVIVLRHAPLLSRIKAVVIRAALIGFVDDMLGSGFVDPVTLHRLLLAILHVGIDKDVDTVRVISEDIVGTATHDDTGFILGDFFDDLVLEQIELVVHGKISHNRETAAEAVHSRREGVEEAVGGFFVDALEDLRTDTAIFCGERDQFFVIKGDAKLLREHLSDSSSAAAELSADRDDKPFHNTLLIRFNVRPKDDGFFTVRNESAITTSCTDTIIIPQDREKQITEL